MPFKRCAGREAMSASNRVRWGVALAVWALSALASAQPFPLKPLRLIVFTPPGGAADVVARATGQQLGALLGHPVVVENKAGASGNIGAATVADAAPDGYTLGWGVISTHAINVSLFTSLPFDPQRDFTPICLVCSVATALVVPSTIPARNVKELIELARAKPGAMNYGSLGSGTTLNLAAALFKQYTGVDIVHVPYKGQSELLSDLRTGRIHMVFNNLAAVQAGIADGSLRAIAMGLPERWQAMPEVATFKEQGLPELDVAPWMAIFGPAKLPARVTERLGKACQDAIADPALRRVLVDSGNLPIGAGPADLAAFQAREIERWAKVIARAGIKPN